MTEDEKKLVFILAKQVKNLLATYKMDRGKNPEAGETGAVIRSIDALLSKINHQTPE